MAGGEGQFIWYELMTSDAEAAGRFYAAVVPGWRFGDRAPVDVDYRMIHRSDGGHAGGVLQLSREMQDGGARPVWLGYLSSDDVDARVAAIEADGGTIQMPPWDAPGVGRLAMVTDPQGAAFYLMKPTSAPDRPDAQSDVFSMDQPQRVRWNELATSDPEGAVAFYSRHFGWAQEGDMDMGPLGKYRFIQSRDGPFGAIMPRMPQMPMSLWTFYIGVDDIDRSAQAIRQGGGAIVQEPSQILGGEYSLVAVDPQGAGFGLVGPRKS